MEGEFLCPNGTCISMSKRCNGASDCSDSFDETNCQTVIINKQLYNKEFPPMNKDDIETEIIVNISISSIDDFNEIDMTFRIKFRLSIQWKVFFRTSY
jgi:hypothetical protein